MPTLLGMAGGDGMPKKEAFMDPFTASIIAGGTLASTLGQGLYQGAQQREQMRREAEMTKGRQLAEIYANEGQQKASSLANLIEAYRSAMMR